MTKVQFVALWAVGAIAYVYVFGFAVAFEAASMFGEHDDLEGLVLIVDAFFRVLMVPGKWILADPRPGPIDLYEILLVALCVVVNLACWGILLPLTWLGLRRITRTPTTVVS